MYSRRGDMGDSDDTGSYAGSNQRFRTSVAEGPKSQVAAMTKRAPMRKDAVMTKSKRKTEATKERRMESEVEKFLAMLSACCGEPS
jgi:hypothetical protein